MNAIAVPKEFYINKDTKAIFVSDFFCEDYVGGAELTLEAIYKSSPIKSQKIHSTSVTVEMIEKNKDKLWILVNFANCSKQILSALVTNKCNYIVIECDYKYCQYRSEHHHVHVTGKQCDCHTIPTQGKWIEAFYKRAKKVFFMSEGQLNKYKEIFPSMKDWSNLEVQFSTWTKEEIDIIHFELTKDRVFDGNGKWAVLNGVSWIKNQSGTEEYCRKNNMEYEVLPRLPYMKFLKELSKYKGLVFHPNGLDTCPRLVVEAKLLGLQLDINDNVQIKNDLNFTEPDYSKFLRFLIDRPDSFWRKIEELIK